MLLRQSARVESAFTHCACTPRQRTKKSGYDLVGLSSRLADLAIDGRVDLVSQSCIVASDFEGHGGDADLLDISGDQWRES